MDFRLARDIKLVGRLRVEGQFDVYNVLNDNAVISQNNAFGSSWQSPIGILSGRLYKFGALLRF